MYAAWIGKYLNGIRENGKNDICDDYNERYVTKIETENSDHVVMYAKKLTYSNPLINKLENCNYSESDLNTIVKQMKLLKHYREIYEFYCDFASYIGCYTTLEFHGIIMSEIICVETILDDTNIDTTIPIGLVYNHAMYHTILENVVNLFSTVEKPRFGKYYLNYPSIQKTRSANQTLNYGILGNDCKTKRINLVITHVDTGDEFMVVFTDRAIMSNQVSRLPSTTYCYIDINVHQHISNVHTSGYTFDEKCKTFTMYIKLLRDVVISMDMYKYCTVVDCGNFKYPKYSIETEEDCYITAHPAPYINIHMVCGHTMSIHALNGTITKGKLENTEAMRCPQCKHDLIPAFEDIFKSDEQKYHFLNKCKYVKSETEFNVVNMFDNDVGNLAFGMFDDENDDMYYPNLLDPRQDSTLIPTIPHSYRIPTPLMHTPSYDDGLRVNHYRIVTNESDQSFNDIHTNYTGQIGMPDVQ